LDDSLTLASGSDACLTLAAGIVREVGGAFGGIVREVGGAFGGCFGATGRVVGGGFGAFDDALALAAGEGDAAPGGRPPNRHHKD
jgi:hypothetical protein